MKKLFTIFLLVILCLFSVGAGILPPVGTSIIIEDGEISSPCITKSDAGTLFLLYIKAGNVILVRAGEGDTNFKAVNIEGLQLENVEKISSITGINNKFIAIVKASRAGVPGLYVLDFDKNENLKHSFNGSLTLEAVETIDKYLIQPGLNGNFLLYYLADSRLYYTDFSLSGKTVDKKILSSENEKVTDYRQHIRLADSAMLFYGIYHSENGKHKQLHYFEIMNNTLQRNDIVYNSGSLPDYEIFIDFAGNTIFNYLQENKIYGKKLNAGSWVAANKGAPVMDPGAGSNPIFYSRIIPIGSQFTAYTVQNGTGRDLYPAARNGAGCIASPEENKKINNSPLTGEILVKPLYGNNLFAVSGEVLKGRKAIVAYSFKIDGSERKTFPVEQPETGTLQEFKLSIIDNIKPVIFKKITGGTSTILQFDEFKNMQEGFQNRFSFVVPEFFGRLKDLRRNNDYFVGIFEKTSKLIRIHNWTSPEATPATYQSVSGNPPGNGFIIKNEDGTNYLVENVTPGQPVKNHLLSGGQIIKIMSIE